MNHLPLVSVCMPAYNAEQYIEAALASVREQTYSNIEVIVVNDGSTDKTAEVLERCKWEQLTIIHQQNSGQCAAANKAFEHSKGAYIKFFDADDLLSPMFIEGQMKRLAGRIDAVASAAWGRFNGDDLSTFQKEIETIYRDMKPIDWLVESHRNGLNMMQCALWLIPRQVLQKSGLWDERLSLINDFDFFVRVLLASNEVLFADDAVLYYRSGINTSLSGQKSKVALESAYLSVELGVQHILAHENTERTRRVCANIFQLWKFQFFPTQPQLCQKAEQWISRLGGSQVSLPGGRGTRVSTQLIGWQHTIKLRQFIHKAIKK